MARKEPGEPFFRVTSEEAKQLLNDDPDTAVVDVRNRDEYEGGHVSNAIHIPVDEVINRIGELPTGKKLFFICAMGQRSGLACEMASAMGIDNDSLYNIEDGTPSWIGHDYPTSYGTDP